MNVTRALYTNYSFKLAGDRDGAGYPHGQPAAGLIVNINIAFTLAIRCWRRCARPPLSYANSVATGCEWAAVRRTSVLAMGLTLPRSPCALRENSRPTTSSSKQRKKTGRRKAFNLGGPRGGYRQGNSAYMVQYTFTRVPASASSDAHWQPHWPAPAGRLARGQRLRGRSRPVGRPGHACTYIQS